MTKSKTKIYAAAFFAVLAASGLIGQFWIRAPRHVTDIGFYLSLCACQFLFFRFTLLFLDEVGVCVAKHKRAFYIGSVLVICIIRSWLVLRFSLFTDVESAVSGVLGELLLSILTSGIAVLLCLFFDKLFRRVSR